MFINTVKKYSPQSINDFVFPNDDAKDIVDAYMHGHEEKPLILHGTNGTGKSLLQRLIPNAIEQREASVQVVKCSDLKSADDIHDLYGRNKNFNQNFTINESALQNRCNPHESTILYRLAVHQIPHQSLLEVLISEGFAHDDARLFPLSA